MNAPPSCHPDTPRLLDQVRETIRVKDYSKAKKIEYEAYNMFYSREPQQTANREEHYRKALGSFQKAYDPKKSPFSLYYIAACYYELGQYDESLKTLKDFPRKYSHEEKFLPLAYRENGCDLYEKR